jgi:two-component system sensor histidine kinase VicK
MSAFGLTATRAKRTKILQGTKDVIEKEVLFFSTTKTRIDTCMSYSRPPLAIGIREIKNAFLDAKSRGVRSRYLTDITNDNISYCKELIKIVDELRHLDGIKGNFMISEGEYLAPVISYEERNIASHLIYSNVDEIVEQQHYMFETLWAKATPAEQRLREIEKGILPIKTKILNDEIEIISEVRHLNKNAKRLSICSGFGGMQVSRKYFFDTYKKIVENEGMRCIVNIDKKDTLDLIKEFLNAGIQVRHVKNMPPVNFGVSDNELAATIEKMEGGKISQSFLISNEPLYINHFYSLFDEIWKTGIDAKERIKAIEEGVDSEGIEIIQDPVEIQKHGFRLIQQAIKEILVMYSTSNAFHRQESAGAIQLLKEAAMQRGVRVRILTPEDELTLETERILMILQKEALTENIGIRYIQPHLQTKVTILIADKKYSLTVELKDDSKQTSTGAIGLATYSDSPSTVLSYASIFESLWTQTELYQKLKELNKLKDEFVNIAAHELRTPIQPILGLAEILRSKLKDGEEKEYVNVIIRNVKRLQRLTEDILDVTRIESNSLGLKKELFNLSEMISTAVSDYNNQAAEEHKDTNIKLEFEDSKEAIFIEADKGRISQVISNFLNNAIKFTNEGTVSVAAAVSNNNNEIVVSVSDTGSGIDSQILPRLFTKFATKSDSGTGLGLYISKSIIEAHGGRIWGKSNYPEGKGATFAFSLPLDRTDS